MIIPFGISGSRHGRKLKISPKKLLAKRGPLVMPSLGSRDKCTIYRQEIKSWICVLTEEVGMQWVLFSYQLILNRSHNVKYNINADYVTGVYFTD